MTAINVYYHRLIHSMSSDTKYGRNKIAPCVDRFPSTTTENSVHVVFFRGGRKLASGLLTFPSARTENNIHAYQLPDPTTQIFFALAINAAVVTWGISVNCFQKLKFFTRTLTTTYVCQHFSPKSTQDYTTTPPAMLSWKSAKTT